MGNSLESLFSRCRYVTDFPRSTGLWKRSIVSPQQAPRGGKSDNRKMVRGNWQKRVETAEARRRETKQRKLKSDEKRIFKGWVHDLWQLLDQHESNLRNRQVTLHVWTDTVPSSSPPLLDLLGQQQQDKQQSRGGGCVRARSSSIESEGSTGTAGGGGGGGGRRPNHTSKKKVHPRSKEAAASADSMSTDNNNKSNGDDGFSSLLLCQRHFLYGKCDGASGGGGGGRKGCGGGAGACKYFHYASKKYLSLAQVLPKDSAQLARVEAALQTDGGGGDSNTVEGALDMLYYSSLQAKPRSHEAATTRTRSTTAKNNNKSEDEDMSSPSLSEEIMSELNRMQTPLASIVYVAADTHLIFDRNQDGGVLAGQLECLVHCNGFRLSSSSSSLGDGGESSSLVGRSSAYVEELITSIPGAVLEHILTFLPDAAVAACCQVCRAWNREIRHALSPHLWLFLLRRRHWSAPPSSTTPAPSQPHNNNNNINNNNAVLQSLPESRPVNRPQAKEGGYAVYCRTMFQNHYRVLRDVRALALAAPSMMLTLHHSQRPPWMAGGTSSSNTKIHNLNVHNGAPEKEVAYQCFAARKMAPNASDSCVSLHEWSPHHILAGYAKDCTLRLFQASANTNTTTASVRLGCRELVCRSIDPYRSTRKRTCTLDAVGLDETTIGCLCHVSAQHLQRQQHQQQDCHGAHVLVVLSRDDFLVGDDSSSTGDLSVIDVGEAVLNFILSLDVVDHRLLPLFDYLTDSGGEVGDVMTVVSRNSIASCGYGRFMVEVSISIPNDHMDVDDDGEAMIQLDRKLVLFSANTHAIVWMGDSYPTPQLPLAATIPAVVSSLRHSCSTGGSRTACAIVTASITAPPTLLVSCQIEPTGHVQVPRSVENSNVVRQSIVSPQAYQAYPSQCLLVFPNDIVTSDTFFRLPVQGGRGGTEAREFKTAFCFFARSTLKMDDETKTESTASSHHEVLHLLGNVRVHTMVSLRDEYIVALCTELVPSSRSTEDATIGTEDLEGQWFAAEQQQQQELSDTRHAMLVIHVPCRQEIGRVPFAKNIAYGLLQPRLSTESNETLALAMGGLGIAMTGYDVRKLVDTTSWDLAGSGGDGSLCSMGHDSIDYGKHPKQAKKKTPRGKKGGSKKDGFARGMSLRG